MIGVRVKLYTGGIRLSSILFMFPLINRKFLSQTSSTVFKPSK